MDTETFHTHADEMLRHLADVVEESDEEGDVDADLQGAVLTITLPGRKQYVVNKHEPTLQLWMSSPITGAHHFSFDTYQDHWIAREGELRNLMAREFLHNFAIELDFD